MDFDKSWSDDDEAFPVDLEGEEDQEKNNNQGPKKKKLSETGKELKKKILNKEKVEDSQSDEEFEDLSSSEEEYLADMPEPITYPKSKSETKEDKKKKLSDEEKEHKDEKPKSKAKADRDEKKPKKKRKSEDTSTAAPATAAKKQKRDPEETPATPQEGEPSAREKQLAEEIKEVLISKGKIKLSELVTIFKPKISAEEKKLFIDIVKRQAKVDKKNGEKYLTFKDK